MKKIRIYPCVLGVALLAAAGVAKAGDIGGFPGNWFYYGDQPAQRAKINQLTGRRAPDIRLAVEHGKFTPPSTTGKVVVVDLWATWCHVCVESIPMNNALVEKYKGKDVVFASICTADGQNKLPEIIKDRGIKYPVVKDPGSMMARAWHVSFYPTYAVVDKKGIVRAIGLAPDSVGKVVDKLLHEGASDHKLK